MGGKREGWRRGFCGTQFVTHDDRNRKQGKDEEGANVMKKQYRFAELSKGEREFHEMILMEEIDVQAWYAITYSSIFGEEVFLSVQ